MRALLTLTVVAGAVALGGCTQGAHYVDDVSAVCVNSDGDRVPDTACGSGTTYVWFYYPSSMPQPSYYQQVVHSTTYVTNNSYQFKAPLQGQAVVSKVPNQPPKVTSPQDRPNPNIKPAAPANPAPKPAPAPAPARR